MVSKKYLFSLFGLASMVCLGSAICIGTSADAGLTLVSHSGIQSVLNSATINPGVSESHNDVRFFLRQFKFAHESLHVLPLSFVSLSRSTKRASVGHNVDGLNKKSSVIHRFGSIRYHSKTRLLYRLKEVLLGQSISTLQNFNVSSDSNLTSAQLNSALVNTRLSGLGKDFILAEKKYHVNALVLTSIAALESSWGGSTMALTKNNLFGYGAYTNNASDAVSFPNVSDSIMTTASLLSSKYLNSSGEYYHGTTINQVNIAYSTNPSWGYRVADVLYTIVKRLN